MGRTKPEYFTVDQVEAALRATGGIKSAAARKLGTKPSTLTGYFKRHPELNDVVLEIKESVLDLAESKLITAIRDGNMTAIIFYLKCQGKRRGYIQSAKVEHTGEVKHRTVIDWKGATLEELEAEAGEVPQGRQVSG
jgi:hypothetical protein